VQETSGGFQGHIEGQGGLARVVASSSSLGGMEGKTGSNNSGSWSFQDTQSIPLQLLCLYTILKNLRLQKYIKTGTKKSLTSYFMEREDKIY
jgi:hypothetical protein